MMGALSISRNRAAWWLYVIALALALAYIGYRLVGTFLVGIFFYYGTRPVYRRLSRVIPWRGVTAGVTLLLTALPAILVLGYLLAAGLTELTPNLGQYRSLLVPVIDVDELTSHPVQTLITVVRNPSASGLETVLGMWDRYVNFATGVLQTFFVALLIGFYLLRDDHRIADWFRDTVGTDSTVYSYATAVDRDLETIYSSNVLLVIVVAILATVCYNGYNMLAPAPVTIPYPTAFAILTGLASLVPLVVGKLVYLPLTVFLSVRALRVDPGLLVWPVALFLVALVCLDLVPMTFVLPELAGRNGHVGMIMFGYVVGAIIFGWYGLFLGPLIVVLVIQAVRIVVTELVQGRPVTPTVRAAQNLGSEPEQ